MFGITSIYGRTFSITFFWHLMLKFCIHGKQHLFLI